MNCRINLRVKEAEISTCGNRISIDLSDVDIDEIISEIGAEVLLEHIGEDEAIKHFKIEL